MPKEFEKIEPTFDGLSDSRIYKSQSKEPERPKRNSFLKKVLKIIGGLVIIFGVMLFSGVGKIIGKKAGEASQEPMPAHDLLKMAVQNANKQLPISVGEGFTLIGVGEGYDNMIIYQYEISESFVLNENFLSLQTQKIKHDYCSEKMKSLSDNGISAQWKYKHGGKKYTITQTPSDCAI